MGRGRTTTGMITACLISSTMNWETLKNEVPAEDEMALGIYDSMDGPSEEEVYLAGNQSIPVLVIICSRVLTIFRRV